MHDYLLETRLKEEDPDLHTRVKNSSFVLQEMLDSFTTWFPDFTDHSILHSMDVLEYCNWLLGDQVLKLTIGECYVLIMSCYLHDVGMGVSRDNFAAFTRKIGMEDYMRRHPDVPEAEIVRQFHQEFSGLFIRKYADLFDFPTEELLFATIQVSRGHRKTDLYDEKEYPVLKTPYGIIRTAFLSAVLRLADEIDVAADRNPELLFDTSKLTKQKDIDAFGVHESIRTVELTGENIILHTKPKEPRFVSLVEDLSEKIQETLDYCRDVASHSSPLCIPQRKVKIVYL